MKKLTTLEQLFVRACKSKDPHKRVASLYRRFYCCGYRPEFVANILAGICDKFLHFRAVELLDEFNPKNDWKYPDKNYWGKCLSILISKIRLSEVSKFEGLTTPAMFRNVA